MTVLMLVNELLMTVLTMDHVIERRLETKDNREQLSRQLLVKSLSC